MYLVGIGCWFYWYEARLAYCLHNDAWRIWRPNHWDADLGSLRRQNLDKPHLGRSKKSPEEKNEE